MFRNVLGRVLTVNDRIRRYGIKLQFVERTPIVFPSLRNFSDTKDDVSQTFDTSLLQFLVCPLSKKPLRYEPETNELINEELGIAYPIIDGIPNMIPQEKLPVIMFSLSTMVGLIPIVSLFGLFYSAAVDENFPEGCTSRSVCFYSLLLPITIPVYVFFHLWSWMGIKLFRHN